MQNFTNALIAMRMGWRNSSFWIKNHFYFYSLGIFLRINEGSAISTYDIMKAYLYSSVNERLWFKSFTEDSLLKFALDEATELFEFMRDNNLFNPDNFEEIAFHDHQNDLVKALLMLKKANIYTEENYAAVLAYRVPPTLASALCRLNEYNLLTEANRDAISKHGNLGCLSHALDILKVSNILTQDNFDAVRQVREQIRIANALRTLNQRNLLTKENRSNILKTQDTGGVFQASCHFFL